MTVGNAARGQPSARGNGLTPSNRQSAVYLTAPDWEENLRRKADLIENGTAKPRFPHIKDLQQKAMAAVRNIDPHIPVRQYSPQPNLLSEGTDSWKILELIYLRLATC